MSSPSDGAIKSKGRKKKDRSVDRHKTRTCPNCYTSISSQYARHVRTCKKPKDIFGFVDPRDPKSRLCHICEKEFDHGHLTRHYRLHVDYSETLLRAGYRVKGDYPQIYKIAKLKQEEEPVCYDWLRNGRSKYNNTYLQYGRKSWFGLEAWRMALLNNS